MICFFLNLKKKIFQIDFVFFLQQPHIYEYMIFYVLLFFKNVNFWRLRKKEVSLSQFILSGKENIMLIILFLVESHIKLDQDDKENNFLAFFFRENKMFHNFSFLKYNFKKVSSIKKIKIWLSF